MALLSARDQVTLIVVGIAGGVFLLALLIGRFRPAWARWSRGVLVVGYFAGLLAAASGVLR